VTTRHERTNGRYGTDERACRVVNINHGGIDTMATDEWNEWYTHHEQPFGMDEWRAMLHRYCASRGLSIVDTYTTARGYYHRALLVDVNGVTRRVWARRSYGMRAGYTVHWNQPRAHKRMGETTR